MNPRLSAALAAVILAAGIQTVGVAGTASATTDAAAVRHDANHRTTDEGAARATRRQHRSGGPLGDRQGQSVMPGGRSSALTPTWSRLFTTASRTSPRPRA